jgi:hypothetical protein
MADLYRDYKPFRNFLGEFPLLESLIHIWRYSLLTIDKVALPSNYISGVPRSVAPDTVPYPWELDLLAREMVLNAGPGGTRSLARWNDLARVMNETRRLDGAAFMLGNDGDPDVMIELHRIAHRQFPFNDIGVFPVVRASKVLGTEAIDEIARRELGLSARQFFKLGTAVSGHFHKQWGLSTAQDYSVIGLSAENTKAFFQRLTIPMADLKRQLRGLQRYDHAWAYTWNPLMATPLVAIDPQYPDRVICPIPHYLLKRTFGGLFYDLINVADFQNPYGNSFQAYIGELLERTCKPSRFRLLAMKPYVIGGSPAHGADWVLSDDTGHIFIEAKTKRLTVKARMAPEPEALDKDLGVLADAVAQNYRNIQDALAGRTDWAPDGLPIYPLILTLEDWFIFSPRVKMMLDDKILLALAAKGIDARVLQDMPWQLGSASEMELASQVIAQVGVRPVMSAKSPEQQGWALMPTLRERFPDAIRNVNPRLLEEDFLALIPEAKPGARPAPQS